MLTRLPSGVDDLPIESKKSIFVTEAVQWLKKLGSQITFLENLFFFFDLDEIRIRDDEG